MSAAPASDVLDSVTLARVVQQPAGNSLKRAWRGEAALACCVPWALLTLAHRRDETLHALRDPALCAAAILSGVQYSLLRLKVSSPFSSHNM